MNRTNIVKQTVNSERILANYFNRFQHLYSYSSTSFIRGLRLFSVFAGMTVVIMGLGAGIYWIYGGALFRHLVPVLAPMQFMSAVVFIFAGSGLILSHLTSSNRYGAFFIRLLRDITILMTIFLAGMTLVQPFLATNLRIAIARIDVISHYEAFVFLLLAIALFTISSPLLRYRLSQYISLLAAVILSPVVISYIYNIQIGMIWGQQLALPLLTTVAFGLLIPGILVARPQNGLMALFTSESAGGFMARSLLFTTILTPVLLGGIVLIGYRLRLFGAGYEVLLLVISTIVVYTLSVSRNARDLHIIDVERRKSVQHMIFLAGASRILASRLEYRSILRNVAELATSHIADWCWVDMLGAEHQVQLVAIAHKNQQKVAYMRKMWQKNLIDMSAQTGLAHVLRTGRSELYQAVSDDMLRNASKNEEELRFLRGLGFYSIMVVPLLSHNKPIGTITFASTDPQYIYQREDLSMAEELATRASLAIENARLYKQAQDATKLRDEFISIASHELKTPVTSLKVYTQVIAQQLKRLKLPEVNLTYVQRMDGQIDKLTKLIEDLLNISRMQMGKLSFEEKEFPLGNLVEEIVESLQPTLEKHKLVLTLRANPPFLGDRDRIGQIIINLITNAIKYSPQATIVRIWVDTKNKEKCMITVQDYGVGIDKKHVRRIFDRFYQVQDTKGKTFPGLGIGLYVSQEIAHRHGGEIIVDSIKGKGSTFSLVLPLTRKIPRLTAFSDTT